MLLDVENTKAAEDLLASADEACRQAGRDPSTLLKTSGCSLGLAGADAVPGGPPSVILRGSTEQIIEKLAAYAAIGVQHFTFWLHPWTLKSVEQLGPIVEAAHKL
jgi:hypothetical protein